ncbi:hypothetical protein D3C75_900590 [compost metagenome]
MGHPARCAVKIPCSRPACLRQFLNVRHQRKMAVTEADDLSRVIIHLRIHIEMIIAAPAHPAGFTVIPDALQMQRQRRIGAGAGDHQIPAVLQEQSIQLRVPAFALPQLTHPFIRRQPGLQRIAQFELHFTKFPAVIGNMRPAQPFIPCSHSTGKRPAARLRPARILLTVVAGNGKIDPCLIRTGNPQCTCAAFHAAAGSYNFELSLAPDAAFAATVNALRRLCAEFQRIRRGSTRLERLRDPL